MELDLSLGDPSKQALGYLSKNREISSSKTTGAVAAGNPIALGLCMAMGKNSNIGRQDSSSLQFVRDHNDDDNDYQKSEETTKEIAKDFSNDQRVSSGSHPPVQLDLLPFASILRRTPSHSQGLPWSSGSSEGGGSSGNGPGRGYDVNILPTTAAAAEEVSSPNSAASSIQMDFSLFRGSGNASGSGNGGKRRNSEGTVVLNDAIEAERASSRASDEDDNNLNPRKKLRLSKEQSAFLEESFKEHSTLNPKRKLALAKQLSLSARQVEVWFQNRRARTKLKQTEEDCEYLKRCCGTLTEENRRLHKELQELRALKASNSNPFYMQPPATTLTMCPSCERVAPTTATSTKPSTAANNSNSFTTRTDISTTPNDKTSIRFPTVITRPSFFPPSNKPTILNPRKGVLNLKL